MDVTKLSDAEWQVMAEVWDRDGATARQVFDALAAPTGWAYNTVRTMLDRLQQKGYLESELQGRSRVYRPLLTRSDARKSATTNLIDRAFGGAAGSLVAALLDARRLTARERRELRRRIAEEEE